MHRYGNACNAFTNRSLKVPSRAILKPSTMDTADLLANIYTQDLSFSERVTPLPPSDEHQITDTIAEEMKMLEKDGGDFVGDYRLPRQALDKLGCSPSTASLQHSYTENGERLRLPPDWKPNSPFPSDGEEDAFGGESETPNK